MRPFLLSTLSLTLLLTACGGGGEAEPLVQAQAPTPALELVARIQAQGQGPERKARAASSISASQVLDWAEFKFPTLFPKGPSNIALEHLGVAYTVRAYGTGNYLGITADGQIYGLGAFTDQQLLWLGGVADYAAQIEADRCGVYPDQCGNNGPLGSLNECTAPAAQLLSPGRRLVASYTTRTSGSEPMSGEYTMDLRVEGSSSFEGQGVIKVRHTGQGRYTMDGQSASYQSDGASYEQIAEGGLIRTVGDESVTEMQTAMGLMKTTLRTVYTPGELNSEYTLRPGQSLTKTTTARTTSSSSVGGMNPPPQTSTSTTTQVYTYEARETVSVQGRSYDSCRYQETDPSLPGHVTKTWILVGHGIPVRSVSTHAGGTETVELKSAELNGSRL